MQLEIPLETVIFTAELAAASGVRVILDPAPAPAGPLDAALLGHVTCLKPNETEAQRLTGIAVSDAASAAQAAEKLLAGGARSAVITLGSKGGFWTGDGRWGFVPPVPVEAVDSTAAGDASPARWPARWPPASRWKTPSATPAWWARSP